MKLNVQKFLSDKLSKFQHQQLGEEQTRLINDWFDEKESAEDKPQVLLSEPSKSELKNQLFSEIIEVIGKENAKHWYQYGWLKVAALLFAISTISLILFVRKDSLNRNQVAYQIYQTHNGEVKKISLPDGSFVWMNAATLIKIPQRFTSLKIREINLEHGEAFFQVKRDTLKPFQIKTGKFLTTVLGTSFNIRSYLGEKSYQVAVSTGKVKVEKTEAGNARMLSSGLVKGEILEFNEQISQKVIKRGNTDNLMAWTTGKYLYLEDMDLLQIGKALERRYGFRVEVRTGRKEKNKYTIAFGQVGIAGAAQQLALETGINYQLTNQLLIINTGK